ncbi:MAG: Pr6Pr family membrane protein [Chloroflexota bacterium]|nr:Pr6Pr family membrane protein [Chloroflexota bacterium]
MRYTPGMTKRNVLIGARLFFGLLALIAIGRQLALHRRYGYSVVNFFSYFTNLSNIFAAAVLLLGAFSLIRHRDPTVRDDIIRGASIICMALVGIVFSLLLRSQDLGALLPWVNIVVHYIMPVVIVLDWLYQPPKAKLTLRRAAYWLIFPFLYVVYSIIRGAIVGWYAYPFFDPARSGGSGGVALYCIAILALFSLLCWLFMTLGNRFERPVS